MAWMIYNSPRIPVKIGSLYIVDNINIINITIRFYNIYQFLSYYFCNQIWRFPKMGLSHIIQQKWHDNWHPMVIFLGIKKNNKPRLNPWHGINSPSRHHQAPVTEKDSRGQNNKILSRWHPHYPDACPNNIPRKHPKKHILMNPKNDH